jgi:anti-sigma regulatory factor (Ser/Thr protein kinase)
MNLSESKFQLSWKYPATLDNVERVCSAAAQSLKKYSFHKKDLFAAELLLREALNNAVLHGCDQNPLLFFSCRLMISGRELIIKVADEGPGFDWRGKLKVQPAHSDESGRGLSIYAIYANSIEFNESGNCVTLTQIFNQGEKDD